MLLLRTSGFDDYEKNILDQSVTKSFLPEFSKKKYNKGILWWKNGNETLLIYHRRHYLLQIVYNLRTLTEVSGKVVQLIKELDRQYPETKVKLPWADGTKTFRFGKLETFCKERGIQQEFSHPYSQEENEDQNAIIER